VGDARPSYRFARQTGEGWRLLEAAAYDAAYYVRHAIPRSLWLPLPPHAFSAEAAADRAAVRAALGDYLTTPPPGTRALQVVDLDVLELRRADYAVVVAVVDAEPDGSDPTWERGRQARWFALVRAGAGWAVVESSPASAPITP
jgi:hypothetical protein